jgi:hypothetical protein
LRPADKELCRVFKNRMRLKAQENDDSEGQDYNKQAREARDMWKGS